MSAVDDGAPALIGRQREREVLDGPLDDMRAGRSRVLVLRGDEGVGVAGGCHRDRDNEGAIAAAGFEIVRRRGRLGRHLVLVDAVQR